MISELSKDEAVRLLKERKELVREELKLRLIELHKIKELQGARRDLQQHKCLMKEWDSKIEEI